MEPGLALSVLMSDPARKKQRSDANLEQREVYITGLSKFVAEKDLRRLFGEVSSRMYGLLTPERD